MGSLQYDCPLCCNESFSSQQLLRYHLLSIIDNLRCPVCSSRFDSIYDLAKHLDGVCDPKAANSIIFDQVQIKIEQEDTNSNDISNSILAKALLSPKKNTLQTKSNEDLTEENDVQENVQTEEQENDEEIYSCSSCGISFTSIAEHINKYHAGQEVVVETANDNDEIGDTLQFTLDAEGDILSGELPEGATLIASDGILVKEFAGLEDDSNDSSENGTQRNRLPQILNTIKQEDCFDKDGRIYTRKVVQIEKFWNDEDTKETTRKAVRRSPIVVKYTLDNEGTLVKAEELIQDADEHEYIDMYTCATCGVQFSRRDQYDGHSCEPEIGSEYKCPICETTFTTSQSLCAHVRIHKTNANKSGEPQNGRFVCRICDTVFPTNKSLRLHRRMHDPVKAKEIEAPVDYGLTGADDSTDPTLSPPKPRDMFQCTVCGKKYDKSYEQMHMAYHEGVNHYDCHICNRKFYTQENLKMHMRVHGTNDDLQKNDLNCQNCKRQFDTEQALEEHIKNGSCSSARPYECSYCSRRFARPHEKVKHERIHTGEKPHECEICGKTFRVSYCLTLHMRTHSGHRPYVCPQCGKRFKAHSVYNHHLLTHSEIRAYRCPYCPKAFKTGVQLAGHKNSHTKPFSCTECNRPFASLYAVRAHMDTHKRDNNLKHRCYLCGASYARAFALRDHIREQHQTVTEESQADDSQQVLDEDLDATESILPNEADDISMVTLESISMDHETVE